MGETKPKKPINLTMVMMTFLTLAVIFSSLAYGYGRAEMATDYSEWVEDNFDILATERGYLKLTGDEDVYVPQEIQYFNDTELINNTPIGTCEVS